MIFKYTENYITLQHKTFYADVPCAIPQSIKPAIDTKNCRFCYFYSPYFKAASDFCGVKLNKPDGEYWGMMSPICLFAIENQELYDGLKDYQYSMMLDSFKHYITDYYEQQYLKTSNKKDGTDFEINLPERIFIFIYDKSVCDDIASYLPSFYEKGFLFINTPFVTQNFSYSSFKVNRIVHQSSIVVKKVSECFDGFTFLSTLYKESLPFNFHPAFRYLQLYQIVEYLMEIKKNEELFNKLQSSIDIFKNDFRESLQKVYKDESLINMLYEGVSRNDHLYEEFCSIADNLFEKINKEKPKTHNDFIAYMYGVRNAIVHNFKETSKFEEKILKLVEIFEVAIYELMITVKVERCDEKTLFVINRKNTFKTNKKAMKKVYENKS